MSSRRDDLRRVRARDAAGHDLRSEALHTVRIHGDSLKPPHPGRGWVPTVWIKSTAAVFGWWRRRLIGRGGACTISCCVCLFQGFIRVGSCVLFRDHLWMRKVEVKRLKGRRQQIIKDNPALDVVFTCNLNVDTNKSPWGVVVGGNVFDGSGSPLKLSA